MTMTTHTQAPRKDKGWMLAAYGLGVGIVLGGSLGGIVGASLADTPRSCEQAVAAGNDMENTYHALAVTLGGLVDDLLVNDRPHQLEIDITNELIDDAQQGRDQWQTEADKCLS